jgi:chemotaxis-related protein WspB
MLLLVFMLGPDRYALDARCVVEVLPLLNVKLLPQVLPAVAGICNYRGAAVPVIDLNQLMSNRPAAQRFSTRIVIVEYRDANHAPMLLGLIAEQVKETVRRDVSEFVASGVSTSDTRYLGPLTSDASGLLQWIHVDKLLPPEIRELLQADQELPA